MPAPAEQLVTTAVARTGVYYKRSGLYAAVIALAGCIGVLMIEDAVPKAVLFVSTLFFSVMAWRTIKTSTRYFDDSSAVLRAVLREHQHIARVRSERGKKGDALTLVVEDDRGDELELRLSAKDGEQEASRLFDAFAEIAPRAKLERDGL